MRKEHVQDDRYGLTPLGLSRPQREDGLMLSKPPLMSRNRVGTFLLSIWRVLILWVRVLQASVTDKSARDRHWWGFIRLVTRATQGRWPFISRSRIFEKIWRSTMTRKEEGES